MKLYIKHDMNVAGNAILCEQLEKLNLPSTSVGIAEIEISKAISKSLRDINLHD